jgi:hypothetical protein
MSTDKASNTDLQTGHEAEMSLDAERQPVTVDSLTAYVQSTGQHMREAIDHINQTITTPMLFGGPRVITEQAAREQVAHWLCHLRDTLARLGSTADEIAAAVAVMPIARPGHPASR